MKDAVLLELASRWEREARPPGHEDHSEASKVQNATASGERQALRACADTLRALVDMLGEEPKSRESAPARSFPTER